jgi:hypothetical protein
MDSSVLMGHHFRGALFVDSAQMLEERDLPLPRAWKVTHDGWYPARTFEDVSVAWLHLIAGGNAETFTVLGTKSADRMLAQYPGLVQRGDLRQSIIHFLAIRACLYDFVAVEVAAMSDIDLHLKLQFGLTPAAEQAAAFHTLGFISRLLELGGAQAIEVALTRRSWEDEGETRLEARWRPPFH